MKVINLTRYTQQVGVRHEDGKLDSVRISPQGRVDLRAGMTVDTRWEQKNPSVVKTIVDVQPSVAARSVIDVPQVDNQSGEA